MTWIDATSIIFAVLTIIVVIRTSHEIKQLLSDARYERIEINRRLEAMARRLDKVDGGDDHPDE